MSIYQRVCGCNGVLPLDMGSEDDWTFRKRGTLANKNWDVPSDASWGIWPRKYGHFENGYSENGFEKSYINGGL